MAAADSGIGAYAAPPDLPGRWVLYHQSPGTAAEAWRDEPPSWADAPPARSMTAAVLAALLDALKYLWVGWSLHIEKSGRALLQPAQAVIDENISPRNLRPEFDHRRSAGPGPGWTTHCCESRWPLPDGPSITIWRSPARPGTARWLPGTFSVETHLILHPISTREAACRKLVVAVAA